MDLKKIEKLIIVFALGVVAALVVLAVYTYGRF